MTSSFQNNVKFFIVKHVEFNCKDTLYYIEIKPNSNISVFYLKKNLTVCQDKYSSTFFSTIEECKQIIDKYYNLSTIPYSIEYIPKVYEN